MTFIATTRVWDAKSWCGCLYMHLYASICSYMPVYANICPYMPIDTLIAIPRVWEVIPGVDGSIYRLYANICPYICYSMPLYKLFYAPIYTPIYAPIATSRIWEVTCCGWQSFVSSHLAPSIFLSSLDPRSIFWGMGFI